MIIFHGYRVQQRFLCAAGGSLHAQRPRRVCNQVVLVARARCFGCDTTGGQHGLLHGYGAKKRASLDLPEKGLAKALFKGVSRLL